MMYLTSDQVKEISIAIVEQAVIDYRNLLVKLNKQKHPKLQTIQEKIDLEIFFRSDYCNDLQDQMDGKKIMKIIREQVKTGNIPEYRRGKRI